MTHDMPTWMPCHSKTFDDMIKAKGVNSFDFIIEGLIFSTWFPLKLYIVKRLKSELFYIKNYLGPRPLVL